jgi:hypothetical protein
MLPRETGRRLGQRGIMFRMNLGYLRRTGRFELDLEALDALRSGAALLIAPNPPALLDVMLVVSRLPRITCIMRAELWNNILLGGAARLARYIRNHSPRSMVKLAVEEIGRARRAGVPVQTVFIETDSPFPGQGLAVVAQASVSGPLPGASESSLHGGRRRKSFQRDAGSVGPDV